MKAITTLIFLLFAIYSSAQIVNIESLRRVNDTSKWSGFTSLDVNLTKNTNTIFNLKNSIHVQYRYKKHLALLVNTIDLKEANDEALVNKGIQHLRYNYNITPKIAWEFFLQSQYDDISNIKFRGLVGTGSRFTLYASQKYNFYLGTLMMYEYEETKTETATIYESDIRGSAYFSCRIYPTDNISFISTTYYQPKINAVDDYRISSETSLLLKIIANLSFKTSFYYTFDAFPAEGVPSSQYKFTNGLLYSFD